jgi:uncharacterized membrane protein
MTPLSKKLVIALVISVALNLLFVGFLVGRGLRRPPGPGREIAALGGPERKLHRHPALHDAVRGHREEFMGRRKAMMQAREEAAAAMRAEPFDRARLEQALARFRNESTAGKESLHRTLVEACSKGSPETRRSLAQIFQSSAARSR